MHGTLSRSILTIPFFTGFAAAGPPNETLPLEESDLQAITLLVLKTHPLLASSPGIKYAAAARRGPRPIDVADVIFHPHVDSGGVKQAYQIQCRRPIGDGSWDCPDVEIRRYLTFASQDFEVRVVGNIGNDGARALIEASRVSALEQVPSGEAAPATATIVTPMEDGYVVAWHSRDGLTVLAVHGSLRAGGNPSDAADWRTQVLRPED